MATLSPHLGVSLETEPTRSSWDRAMGILEFHKAHVVSAVRGIDVLLRYRQSIMMRTDATLGMYFTAWRPLLHSQHAMPTDKRHRRPSRDEARISRHGASLINIPASPTTTTTTTATTATTAPSATIRALAGVGSNKHDAYPSDDGDVDDGGTTVR